MNNIDFLKEKGMLENIRYSLGIDENDNSMDETINNMSPLKLTRQFCEYELGDGDWASVIIGFYTGLTKIKENKND